MTHSLTIHHCWVQGAAALPAAYAENIAQWRQEFPGATFRLWDHEQAARQWSDYRALQGRCSHHAMRADLIQARALRDFGGLCAGTDARLVNPAKLRAWLQLHDTLVIANMSTISVSNDVAYFREPGHPYIQQVCRAQVARPEALTDRRVDLITGPQCWGRVLHSRSWDLCIATMAHAYTHQFHTPLDRNPNAWIDPGYAASWHWKPITPKISLTK